MFITQRGPGFPILADFVFAYISCSRVTNLTIHEDGLPLNIKRLVEEVRLPTKYLTKTLFLIYK